MMEVLAGFMAQTDHEIGRMLDTIRDIGQSDNTLVVFIAGDNGASLQGDSEGKFSLQVTGNGVHETRKISLAVWTSLARRRRVRSTRPVGLGQEIPRSNGGNSSLRIWAALVRRSWSAGLAASGRPAGFAGSITI